MQLVYVNVMVRIKDINRTVMTSRLKVRCENEALPASPSRDEDATTPYEILLRCNHINLLGNKIIVQLCLDSIYDF